MTSLAMYYLRFLSRFTLGVCAVAITATASGQGVKESEAIGTDTWSQPFQGVRYLTRQTNVPAVIHALVVDLKTPGVRVIATPYDDRWQTVSEFATHGKLAAAINGGYWGMLQRAEGVTAGGGKRWPQGEDDEEVGFFALTAQGKAWISSPERVEDNIPPHLVTDAVSGFPQLVRNGKVDDASLEAFESSKLRHPRTAVGVGDKGRKVILVVVDGRQGHSRGISLYGLARLFVELGAESAINLDGGGSSAMYVDKHIVNSPSGGRWEAKFGFGAKQVEVVTKHQRVSDGGVREFFVRGVEREVMNHLGVIAPKEPLVVKHEIVKEVVPRRVVTKKPRDPMLRLGRLREAVAPIMLVACGLLIVGGVVWFIRRRARQRDQLKRDQVKR